MKEQILWCHKIGTPEWNEIVLSTKPEQFKDAERWAKVNGYDNFRIAVIDLNEKPDFRKTINKD